MDPYKLSITLEDRLHLKDAISFCKHKNANALALLREKHEGRCYPGGYYILKVAGLKYISPCFIDQTDQKGSSYVSCLFEAEVHKYRQGDIIPIVPVQPFGKTLEGSAGELNIVLYENPIFTAIQNGQVIACTLKEIRAFQSTTKVSAIAEMYQPIAQVVWPLSDSQEPDLKALKAADYSKTKFGPIFFRTIARAVDNSEKQRSLIYEPLTGKISIGDVVIGGKYISTMAYVDENETKRVLAMFAHLVETNEKHWTEATMKKNENVWKIYGL
ncbi:hypothetical protein KDA11_04830 [Candidatus Saccharibacteria bacterium]|nr:hypothetical protein [Candidatus Saccharibacteria bacterium]